MLASLSTRAKRKGHQRVSFSFGGIIIKRTWLRKPKARRNPVRIRHSEVGELAHQTESERIFAKGEIPERKGHQRVSFLRWRLNRNFRNKLTTLCFYAIINSRKLVYYENKKQIYRSAYCIFVAPYFYFDYIVFAALHAD